MDTSPGSAPATAGAERPVLDPARAIADGWTTFKANAWIGLGVAIVLGAILVAGQFVPIANLLFLLLVAPALYAGGAGYFLRGARGERPPFEAAFEGFQRWPSATGTVFLIGCVSLLLLLPMLFTVFGVAGIAALVEARPDRIPDLRPGALGVLWLMMLVTYPLLAWWSLRTSMALFVVMEPERPGVMESLRRSWSLTRGSLWRLVGFALLTIPVVLLGALALCVGMVPALIVVYFGWAHAYLQLRARA